MAARKPRARKPPAKPRAIITKLNEDTQKAICDVIRAGNYMETAAAYAGINRDTLYEWMKKGRAARTAGRNNIYSRFVEELELALAQGEVRDLAIIGKAAEQVWQAAAWRLERRMPDKYGRRTRVEHDTPDGKPFPLGMSFDPDVLSVEELERLKELLDKAQPPAKG